MTVLFFKQFGHTEKWAETKRKWGGLLAETFADGQDIAENERLISFYTISNQNDIWMPAAINRLKFNLRYRLN